MSNQTVKMKEHSSIEIRGVDMIPENERNSKASNVFYVLCGSQFAFGIMAIGHYRLCSDLAGGQHSGQ